MLAVHGSPFDSPEYIFEPKLDGYRAVVFRDNGSYRIMSRNSMDLTPDFPELEFLGALPQRTVLDGELVALVDGKPDFGSLKSRGERRNAVIAYFAFDVLYENYEPRMALSLTDRKSVLSSLLAQYGNGRLFANRIIDTNGKAFFEEARSKGLEGIMAKHKLSEYKPGKREAVWKKIKVPSEILCIVIGYVPKEGSFKSLLLASEIAGKLRYVGKVGTGFSRRQKDSLMSALRALMTQAPLVETSETGVWVKPGLYCKIAYTEFTHDGLLRAPVFESLVKG